MTKFFAFIFASFLANTALASWVAPVSVGACTRDFNAFGQASVCECPHATRYENRIGQCVQGAPVEITQVGVIGTEFAIGGETTGIVLTTSETENYELVLPRAIRAQVQDENFVSGQYRIFGEVIEVEGVESGKRPTIIVDRIELIDADAELTLPTDLTGLAL